jgi:histidyl-tRNA synthetase
MNEPIKGFRDYVGEDAERRAQIKKILVGTFESYGFEPAETPIVESEEFVKGDNEKDEAVSDIYKLEDKGNRKLALRYEFTFQLKRIANNMKLPFRRYQIGEVFRDEPASSRRFRQFTQCDIDVVGSTIKDEAEILFLASEVLKKIGVKSTILINNRKLLNEILESERIKEKDKRAVLTEIDKFDKISEKEILANLKKYKAEKILGLLKKGEDYFKKFESYKEILELIKYCNYYGVKVLFSPTIIRGLSYYDGSIFEIKAEGIKETITAGGSYKVNGIQSAGISFGLDRLAMISRMKLDSEKYLIISLDEDKAAISLAEKLREQGKNVVMFYGKPSRALEYANSYKIGKVIFVGSNEVKEKKFKVKDMGSGRTSELKI